MRRFSLGSGTALAVLLLVAVSAAAPAAAQTPLLELQRSDSTDVLHVNDDGGFSAAGAVGAGAIPASGRGTRFMWYPGKAVLRVGSVDGSQWDDANVGRFSFAFGDRTVASGEHSLALGNFSSAKGDGSIALNQAVASGVNAVAIGPGTAASGLSSMALGLQSVASAELAIAMGLRTVASGQRAVAIGSDTKASEFAATATGNNTTASGQFSTAMGTGSRAMGAGSVAMGTKATAVGDGSFAFADGSGKGVSAENANQFVVRASGGYVFYSSTDQTRGCFIPPGESISCASSRLVKERFEPLDADTVLAKVARLPIQAWSYRGNKARHVGPVAEDFYAAFGLGTGPRTVSFIDTGGISLVAVQVLERRTAALRSENAALRAELDSLREAVRALAAAQAASRRAEPHQ
ncbi:MAG TPA: tail fiber domain-containing protein [Gemmatimonadales bacterium]|nr:tail fiber domain-containing protein [Gemmatimonadales bacterium]